MEESILKSIKKIINLEPEYTAFDSEIIIFINSVFSTLNQLGVGPSVGFYIEDDNALWEDYVVSSPNQLGMVKTLISTKVRLMFDPPANSFGIDALKDQITEQEWRLNFDRESALADEEVVP